MTSESATLIIGPSWVGDMVMAQCLFAALKQQAPNTPIDVVGPDWASPVLARMVEVRSTIPVPFRHGEFALARRIAFGTQLKGQYTSAYVLPGSWKSAVIPAAAAIPRRCGYLREWRHGLLNDIRVLHDGVKLKTAIAFQALADPEVLVDPSRLFKPKLRHDADNRKRLLIKYGLCDENYVVFAPGAEFGEAKRWPPSYWAQLARVIRNTGTKVAILGSAADRETGAAIAAGDAAILNLAGKTRLEDAIDLISACKVAVSNDSGLMHIAAAVGVPVAAIYGSTSPLDTPPLSSRAEIVSLALPCSPCRSRRCPLGHTDCMNKMMPEQIAARMNTMAVL